MLSFTDLCVYWSVLIHLYDDDTIQVSILYECSLLIEWCTRFHCYLMCDLYRCVSHMTHVNLMRSGYLSIYLIDKIFCSHKNRTYFICSHTSVKHISWKISFLEKIDWNRKLLLTISWNMTSRIFSEFEYLIACE